MITMRRPLTVFALMMTGAVGAEPPAGNGLIDRVDDTGFVRVEARSFASLDARHQALAYWLTQAAIATDPIAYDQFSSFGLRQKRLLEGIVAHTPPSADDPVRAFTKKFWANRGNHNEVTAQKILPAFTFEALRAAAHAAHAKGAFRSRYATLPPLKNSSEVDRELSALRASLFDPAFEPMLTAKNPGPGKDLIQSSSNTFYPGLSAADLANFKDAHALNSRVVRAPNGALEERVYRAGTADGRIPPGLYADFLRRANVYLANAQKAADPLQARVIGDLIRYYETGAYSDWIQFGTNWVQNDSRVDFDSGFIEIYRDVRGAKGSSQAFVSITDEPVTQLIARLAANADYFEQHAPWDAEFKRASFKPPVVKAIETLTETGDFSVTTIGDNLPNEEEIHQKYGTKNFLFTSSTRALNAAFGHAAYNEFAATPEIAARIATFGDESEDLLTALHEVIGHGAGRVSDRLSGTPQSHLREYYSTLEEGRADLMGLWNVWDPKLKELALVSNQEEVAKAMYDGAVLAPLLELRYVPHGDTIEEDHQRDRALIVNFIRDRVPGSIRAFDRDGKSYIEVQDYQKMREGVRRLLSELMRIKGEGDYAAIKALVDQYAVHFDTARRDQVVARFKKLGLPTYFAGINASLTASIGADGSVKSVRLDYPDSVEGQYLTYASMYDPSLNRPTIPSGSAVHQSTTVR